MADYNRYKAEYTVGDEFETSVANACNFYKLASNQANNILSPTDPLRLHIAISKSTFYYEVLKFPYSAYQISYEATRCAKECPVLPQSEQKQKTYSLLMAKLSENMIIYQVKIIQRMEEIQKFRFDYFEEELVLQRLRRRGLIANIN